MDLHGRALLLLLSALSALGGNVTEEESQDKIGKTLTVFNVVKFPNDPCTSTTNHNGTCYTATECKTLGGVATGSCASSFGVCCVFSITCGQTSSQNNTYIEQATYTVGTDADPCTYKICPSGTVSKLKLEFNTLELAKPKGDADLASVNLGSPFYTGHCLDDSMHITSPGHASPPEICGLNTGQHMFIPMSDQCVMINLNIGTSAATRSWNIKAIQYEAGNPMAPEGNCLQYHSASSGTFASFGWDLATYGPGIAATSVGISPYTQFHLANQHYDICFRREQGMTAICYTPKILATTTVSAVPSAASFGLGASAAAGVAIGAKQQTDGIYVIASAAVIVGRSACQGLTVFTAIAAAIGLARTTGDYLEIPQAFDLTASGTVPTTASTSKITRVCGNVFAATATDPATQVSPLTICSKTTPFRIGVHMDATENFGQATAADPGDGMLTTFSDAFDNYVDSASAPTLGWGSNEGQGYAGFYLSYWQTS